MLERKWPRGHRCRFCVWAEDREEPQCSDSLACGPNPAHRVVILGPPPQSGLFWEFIFHLCVTASESHGMASLFCGCNVMYAVCVLFHILYLKIKQNKNEKNNNKKKHVLFYESGSKRSESVHNSFLIIWTAYSSIELFGAVTHSAVKKKNLVRN